MGLLKDTVVNERVIEAKFDAAEIRTILTKRLAEQTGFEIDPRQTLISVVFLKEDSSIGFKDFIKVRMVNKLGEPNDDKG